MKVSEINNDYEILSFMDRKGDVLWIKEKNRGMVVSDGEIVKAEYVYRRHSSNSIFDDPNYALGDKDFVINSVRRFSDGEILTLEGYKDKRLVQSIFFEVNGNLVYKTYGSNDLYPILDWSHESNNQIKELKQQGQ